MRTTITLDDDVAAQLKELRRGRSFKELVNETLRRGLEALSSEGDRAPVYRIRPVKGRPRRSDLDNVAELIAETESDGYR
jgi:hypothetical protein